MAQNKFKKGDVVTPVRDAYGLKAGNHYTVTGEARPTGPYNECRWVALEGVRHPVADDGSFCEDDLRLIKSAPAFKVGDKVRVVKPGTADGGSCHGAKIGDVLTVTRVNERCVDTATWAFYFHEIEPASATGAGDGALRIEAGRYYSTRDGRKVGPMKKAWNGGWLDVSQSITTYNWCASGKWFDGSTSPLDLVAEWTDDPWHTRTTYTPPVAEQQAGATGGKFKVGDRVVVVVAEWGKNTPVGSAATIVRILNDYDPPAYTAKIDGGDGFDWFFPQDSLAHPTPNPAIVAKLDNGQPRPATRPYVHADTASATTEAKRLARNNPGVEFGVYELVATRKEEQVYDHEWQRLAAEGREYEAACALQDAAGTSFHGAQAAVTHWRQCN